LSPPTLTFVAGANGSGKTTLTRWNSELFQEIPVLDPDTIGKTLQSMAAAAFPIAGARQVLKSANEHLRKAESFAIETTLAGNNYLRMMIDARLGGFEIVLVYIGTENVEINLAESEIGSSRAVTMSRKKTSDAATNGALKICRLP
jgi:predicted ABC-type ATPase